MPPRQHSTNPRNKQVLHHLNTFNSQVALGLLIHLLRTLVDRSIRLHHRKLVNSNISLGVRLRLLRRLRSFRVFLDLVNLVLLRLHPADLLFREVGRLLVRVPLRRPLLLRHARLGPLRRNTVCSHWFICAKGTN